MNEGKIKFHSIYYRYILFLFSFSIMTLYAISDAMGGNINFFNGFLVIEREWLKYIVVGVSVIIIGIFSFVKWKFYICKTGIYLRKIDLLVPWEDIVAVSHIWLNEASGSIGNLYLYHRKTLVIYRKQYKPICIYNISVLALYAAKFYNPYLKTNIVSATLATIFNVILNGLIFYELWFNHLNSIKLEALIVWAILYAIKSSVFPLVMVKHQNKLYGAYLFHDTAYKKNPSNAIHL
ncbi:hypothetical protein [Bulleidia sp. zg-1006]|uniref:hypothetical protein n=1 Tax=Bulleidia sp. zg-1006 TaxID=2806552 RepID=UPI00193ABDFA|nr:hypothetical protein [Bulleidia sp. zg-1006]QRG87360.1 hypothetical protein JOS54_03370 [Bulleidia sp. zg-1006]